MQKKTRKRLFLAAFLVMLALLPVFSQLGANADPRRVSTDAPDLTGKVPIVYHPGYNITFLGLEKLHPFDSTKYAHVYNELLRRTHLKEQDFIRAAKPGDATLADTHTPRYLQSLRSAETLSHIAEMDVVATLPDGLAWNLLAEKMLYQSGGGIMAAQAALQRGWAINMGGGFHHASRDNGEGFCIFADISMIVRFMRAHAGIRKIMIVDLDAHQGNGHARDFMDDADIYILDAYNAEIYPQDAEAQKGITRAVTLTSGTDDAAFLPRIEAALDQAFADFDAELVIYIAGTDVLEGDPLGAMDITPDGVMQRDAMVFARALEHKAPVVMLFGGGYQQSNAGVIADSILNLRSRFKLF